MNEDKRFLCIIIVDCCYNVMLLLRSTFEFFHNLLRDDNFWKQVYTTGCTFRSYPSTTTG